MAEKIINQNSQRLSFGIGFFLSDTQQGCDQATQGEPDYHEWELAHRAHTLAFVGPQPHDSTPYVASRRPF